MIMVTQNPPKI